MTNARSLANFATGIGTEGAILTVDNTNNRIGIATTNPQNDLQVGLGITMEGDPGNVTFLGIVTASSYEGDGSNLTGITAGYWEQTDAGINTTSSVGIGTTNPGFDLDVENSSGDCVIALQSPNTSNTEILFGDPDSSFSGRVRYGHSTNHLQFNTNASERLRILSDGKVGVGTTIPASIMHIHANSASTNVLFQASAGTNNAFFGMRGSSAYKAIAANDAYIYQNGQNIAFQADDASSVIKFAAGGNQEQVRIDSSGRLLVGTTSGSGEPIAAFQGRSNDADDSGIVAITRTGASPSGSIGEVRFATGSNFDKYYGMIICASDGSTSASSLPGVLRFSTTASGSTSPTERLRIDSSGDVHIGDNASNANGHGLLSLTQNAASAFNALVIQQGNTLFTATDGLHIGIDASVDAYIKTFENRDIYFTTGTTNSEKLRINNDGSIVPGSDNSQDLGSTSLRWANIYSADLQLSNEGMGNDVDGTWGQYTIQEGENDLFLLNRRNGKKYRFMLEEV